MLDVGHFDLRHISIGVLGYEQQVENADDLAFDEVHEQPETLAGHVPSRPLHRQIVDRSQNGVSYRNDLRLRRTPTTP